MLAIVKMYRCTLFILLILSGWTLEVKSDEYDYFLKNYEEYQLQEEEKKYWGKLSKKVLIALKRSIFYIDTVSREFKSKNSEPDNYESEGFLNLIDDQMDEIYTNQCKYFKNRYNLGSGFVCDYFDYHENIK